MEMTERRKNDIMLWGTLFFTRPVDTNRPSIPGRYCSVRKRYFQRTWMGHNSNSSQSSLTKSSSDGTENSSKRVRYGRILGFGHKVRMERERAQPPSARITIPEGKAVQITNPFHLQEQVKRASSRLNVCPRPT